MTDEQSTLIPKHSPPAQGVRLDWHAIPSVLRARLEEWLGSSVIAAESQASGFSPGVASRLRTADDRRVFLKAIGPEPNPASVDIHRREALITAMLPHQVPAPRLLWSCDDREITGWVLLVFQDIVGRHPSQPWRRDELRRVLGALHDMVEHLTPSPIPTERLPTASTKFQTRLCGWQLAQSGKDIDLSQLDSWTIRNLDRLARVESSAPNAVLGNSLVHFDVRADNILMTDDKVWFLDWPHACLGPSWLDVVTFAPSVAMQGGPPPEEVIQEYPGGTGIDPDSITAAVVSIAGFFTYQSLLPPPPGLPTLRQFQAAQGVEARQWIAYRTGWT